jgi:hypothetical protein
MRFITRLIVILALLLTAHADALAWHDTGHMVVAQVAYLRLTPAAKARVDALLLTPQGKRPLISIGVGYYTPEVCERTYDPVQIAVWMDDMRGDSLNDSYAPWHYINFNPFFDGIPERTDVGPEPENVLSRINWAVNMLRKGTGSNKTDAETLGFLIHMVGDVHQPLHAATRYSAANRNGDAGGNLFKIQMPPEAHVTNLHAFWDAAAGTFGFNDPKRPLDQAGKDRMVAIAQEVMKQYPDTSVPEWKNLDPHEWVVESNTLARQVAYKNITEGGTPSQAYTDAAQQLSRKRLALGGYRLAGVLNALFVAPPKP